MSSKRKPKPRRVPADVPGVTQFVAGPGPVIDCDGRAWRLGFNTQNAKARLEELVRAHVLRESKLLGPEEYQDTKDKVLGGYYRTFAKGWLAIINSVDGAALYLLSLLQHHHPGATADDATRLMIAEAEQVEMALAEVSPDFFRAAALGWAAEKRIDPEKAASAADEVAAAVLATFGPTRTTAG